MVKELIYDSRRFGVEEIKEYENLRGVGAVITNSNGEVLVGVEKIEKEAHNRKPGQISIPLETLKPFERKNRDAMILASISEIASTESAYMLRKNLTMLGISSPFELNEEGLLGAVLGFRWEGDSSEMPFCPAVPSEFGDLKWIRPDELLAMDNVRPFCTAMIQQAEIHGFMNGTEGQKVPVFESVNWVKHGEARELHPDVS